MTLEDALALKGLRIAAWDRSSGGAGILSIVALDRKRAEVVAQETVAKTEQAATEEKLRQHGILIGGTCRRCDFVWVFDGAHCCVVRLDHGVEAEAIGGDLVIGGRRFPVQNVRAVVSFVDRANIAHRGVKLQLANGSEPVVVEEIDLAPGVDPGYGRTNLEIDAGWIVFLGRELAANLHVRHRDELWDKVTPPPAAPRRRDNSTDALLDGLIDAYEHWDDPDRVAAREARAQAQAKRDSAILDLAYIESGQRGDAPMDVALAKMADHFAARIERDIPAKGEFEAIHQPLPEIENGGYIALDLRPLESATRLVELRVESPSGENKAVEIVHTGTNVEVVRFLRSPSLPGTLLAVMGRLTETTRDR